MKWSESDVAKALVGQFLGKFGIVCPNCYWTGYECDLLVVHHSMRLIDVEIKISRADLKIDREKDKWWRQEERWFYKVGPPAPRLGRDWPPKVWKHYYVLPKDVWKPELAALIPPKSGVLTVREGSQGGYFIVESARRVTANRDAQPITTKAAMEIARLLSARYWQSRLAGQNEIKGEDDDNRDPGGDRLPDPDVQPG